MSTAEPEPSSVPVPANVRIQSYDLKPALYWDYQSVPQTPVFTIEVKSCGWKTWIYACNTSDHHCNILNVDDLDLPIWAKVKARIGQKESAYVESKDFVIFKEGKVGPPELTVTQEEDYIIIDMVDSVVHVNGEKQEAMHDACYTLIYKVYVRENTIFILISAYCCFKKNPCKKKNMLPKSLLSVVKSATSETKPESKYVTFISSCQPIALENEVLFCAKEVSAGQCPALGTSPEGGPRREERSGELSTETEALTLDASGSDWTLTENSLHSNNNQLESCSVVVSSYHSRNGSDSGLVGSDSFISHSEIPPSHRTQVKTEGEEPTVVVQRSAPTSFG
ncbi:Interferon-gamma receptor alpha chain [Heterocephalus glaber]|uniref:Interferon-gamma receptor alpha chain n=1 Tax=Heterocephalus glaber TaxID=10181 RepID=G5ATX5_HETGA|nr:Interferon-gamma receptor alpha chain [Heterocephalus glaber]